MGKRVFVPVMTNVQLATQCVTTMLCAWAKAKGLRVGLLRIGCLVFLVSVSATVATHSTEQS